jgi:uncharacterized membrane protein YcaP (DUF421 family)
MGDYTFDLTRIFFGELPLLFLVEILLRTSILYIYLLGLLRLSGQRSLDKLTPIDVVLIVSLGSAVGDPAFYMDIPLIYGLAVITIVVALRYLSIRVSDSNDRAQQLIQGHPQRIIKDGVMHRAHMESAQILRDEVFENLREKGYTNLGQISRAYIETEGELSIFPAAKAKRGLSIEPPWELEPPTVRKAGARLPKAAWLACFHCGLTKRFSKGAKLPVCEQCEKSDGWVAAS